MQVLNVGVVGLGVGERHVESYQAIEGCEVRSICDIDADKLRDVGERYRIDLRYADYRAIRSQPFDVLRLKGCVSVLVAIPLEPDRGVFHWRGDLAAINGQWYINSISAAPDQVNSNVK